MKKHAVVISKKSKRTGLIISEKKEYFFSIYNAERRAIEIEDAAFLSDSADIKTIAKVIRNETI